MTQLLRRLRLGAVAALAVMLLVGAGLWMLQRRLIYFPDGSVPELAVAGDGWDQVGIETLDGLELAAWYHAPDQDQPVVIVFNGNAGNRAGRVPLGQDLAAHGLGVLLTDYRGYGGNPGHPTEEGLAADSRAALAYARTHAPGHPIVYFGESLGAAVAIELAVTDPPVALILRSPFTSLVAVGKVHYPWLPVSALLKDRYPSDERIGSVHAPTMVIAGDADSLVPIGQSRQIYESAPGEKRLLVIAGADHNDPALVAGVQLTDAVAAFVAESNRD